MKYTTENIFDLTRETAARLSAGEWGKFLHTAVWNYKYDFVSQLLIYAQKPDAIACASYGVWTEKLHRVPRKGTAITLIRDIGDKLRLHHVFDFSDTFPMADVPPISTIVPVAEQGSEATIRRSLIENFLPSEPDIHTLLQMPPDQFYRTIAYHLAEEVIVQTTQNLLALQEDNGWANIGEAEIKESLQALIVESISAMLQIRCGLTPVVAEEIMALSCHFDTIAAMSVLGTAIQSIAKPGILEVTHAIRQWEKEKKEEQSYGYSVSAGGRAQSSKPVSSLSAELEQVRTDAKNILEGTQDIPVQQPYNQRSVESGVDGLRQPCAAVGGMSDGKVGQSDDSSTAGRFDHHGSLSVGPSENSGSGNSAYDDLRITEEDIVRALQVGPPLEGGKYRLYAAGADKQVSEHLLTKLVCQEYGAGSRAFQLSSGMPGILSWDASGLRLSRSSPFEPATIYLPWNVASARLQALIDSNLYLSAAEANGADAYFASQEALDARQQLGETIRVFLSIYDPNLVKQDLTASQEMIRAYVFENSETARQFLLGKLLELGTTLRVQSDTEARSMYQKLFQTLSASFPDTALLPSATDAGISLKEPLIDHPELIRKDLSRLGRADKVALTDLLLHQSTYRGTFNAYTPPLSHQDASFREEQLALMDDIVVTDSVEENLEHIRLVSTLLTRWYLPFEGIRPDILRTQEQLISAGEQVLMNPPEQTENLERSHNYNDEYKHIYEEPQEDAEFSRGNPFEEPTLWDFSETNSGPIRDNISETISEIEQAVTSGTPSHSSSAFVEKLSQAQAMAHFNANLFSVSNHEFSL